MCPVHRALSWSAQVRLVLNPMTPLLGLVDHVGHAWAATAVHSAPE